MYRKAISEGEVRGGDVARGGTLVDPVDLLACLPLMFLDVFGIWSGVSRILVDNLGLFYLGFSAMEWT